MAHEHEHAIRELRRQAEEQPEIQKRLWKRQLSQQSTYKAEIHELYTEMLNMREKSEMHSHLAANMCKIEHSVPSRSVESEPENVLNTRSPGRCSRWLLPEELEAPNRPTSSGLQSPVGVPVQLGPSPQTREYVHTSPCGIPPAQWGDVHARDREEECELFGEVPPGQDLDLSCNVSENEEHQEELDNAAALPPVQAPLQSISGARCVNGNLVRPDNTEEESPSTACRPSVVHAPGGAALGRGPPGFGKSPGSIPGRQVPPPPPPPPPAPVPHGHAMATAVTYPREWTPLHTRPKATGGGGPPDRPGGGTGAGVGDHSNSGNNPSQGGGPSGSNGSGGAQPPGGGNPGGNPGGNQGGGSAPSGSTPPQQSGGAGCPGGTPPSTPPGIPHSGRHSDPWAPLDRSRKALPKLSLPSNYKHCSILDMQQILESWYDKSTFAIATWRGDAQKYWLTQVLDCARSRHDQWLQSTPSQRASLEPAYILGDRKRIPEAQNAVESVLDAIPKSIADACMRHGYCTAELIVWYVMKQLILPPDINEVTMQREILTPPPPQGASSHAGSRVCMA